MADASMSGSSDASISAADVGGIREPQVGDTVGGYLLVDALAAGGMGRVFRAVDRTGKAYALKTILRDDRVFRRRFEREIQVGMLLDHPNLVRLVDCDIDYPWPYLVQELLMGVNLRDLYKARRRLPERAVMFVAYQIAQALNAALRYRVIHRDIKPDNVFMTTTGDCKLLDMGLVKVGGMERVTEAQDLVGTLQFMAPEQLQNATTVDHHADIYSLGATAFLLLTGKLPRKGGNVREIAEAMKEHPVVAPRDIHPQISPDANRIIMQTLMVDPEERYATPQELVDALEGYFRRAGMNAGDLTGEYLLQALIPEGEATAPRPKRLPKFG